MEVNRRTQADRSATTKRALVDAARPLFAEHGFGGVGTEAIVRAAGVTRGAMYHQFADKTELFAAVFEAVEVDVMARLGALVAQDLAADADPIDVMVRAMEGWLEVCADPEVARLALIEAPSVLGWERWRAIGEQHAIGVVEALVVHAIELGRLPPQPPRPLVHVIIGAADEAALYVARAPDAERARAEMTDVLTRLARALAVEG
ncbi:helix-turn-helix domain-containing protein [Patulibacter brassicae]|jgi:AcrR family transcriptional regulator|uniref:Helix-turn-helix domain-containing protein n=1 Tax=Patulibacter brassicae TaxID=1705717 RepID=A0ABU4VLP4_9ACTN|nr:helix-turn-helix domain-containing protein [Patulibacter brassicae]MDX8152282.1 helix-turn-helix domain-containing protein [Patulibacter brassicae]